MRTHHLSVKIENKTARIGVLGLGYVGLPLALEFSRNGFHVTGFEVREDLVRSLRRGLSHVADVSSETVRDMTRAGRFHATDRFEELRAQDVVIICVPTPLRKTREPDISFIRTAAKDIPKYLRRGQLVVLESTTYPGTTRDLVLPWLERKGLRAGRDFYLAFSPERVDPANKTYRIFNTPKVVGGLTPACADLACRLYSQVVERVVPVSSAEAAEMVKLLENTFRAVNIALINEMALMCHRLGLDVWEIIRAASTKPFGFMPFYPGPGIGGHCIPLDPQYLAWKMRSMNFDPRFIELAGVINRAMPKHVLHRIAEILNTHRKSLKGSRILVLGVTYKADVSDVRESPALDVISLLRETGCEVAYHDPWAPSVQVDAVRMRSKPLSDALLKACDLTAILTAHSAIDYRRVLKNSKAVFDTRNALAGMTSPRLFRL